MSGVQPLVVQGVPDLVQQGEEPAREVARVIPQRDANVARPNRCAERMLADIESSSLEIEAERRGDTLDEDSLPIERKLASQHMARRRRWCVAKLARHRYQLALNAREEPRHPLRRHSGLVVVEKRVVAHPGITHRSRFLARQREE